MLCQFYRRDRFQISKSGFIAPGCPPWLRIEVLNVEYNDEEQITGLHLGPAIVKETVEILDGYTYFREGEPVALTREELAKIAKVVIRANQSLSPVDVS